MKDFPVFTTEYGVASLVLREIPYRREAYVVIQASENPAELLQECISFCRMCGAEKIYARGHRTLDAYPLHSILYEMRGVSQVDENHLRSLWPVTGETVTKWREKMNQRMSGVDHARTLVRADEKEILESGGAYFVHDDGKLLGAGWIHGEELRLLASYEKGVGKQVLHTLLSTVADQPLTIEVVSTNTSATRLYEASGFVIAGERYRWYRVFPEDSMQH